MADLAALKSAARAAIVMPAVFALADKVIAEPQTSLFAAFGSFALLVLADFAGPPRSRLLAYVGLAVAGGAFIVLGTLCSRNAWLGAGAMAAVGFAVLLSGVFGGYFAAASTGALLTFVLPVTVPAANSAIPDRLEGWGLAAGAGICAAMVLWPPRRRSDLARRGAEALRAVADVLDAAPGGMAERAGRAREASRELARSLLAVPHRPTGPTGPMAALAALPDEVDWLLSFLTADRPALELACPQDAEAMAAAAAALRVSAESLEGGAERLDFARLDSAREAVAQAVVHRLSTAPPASSDGGFPQALDSPFRIRAVTYSARQIAGYALLATGAEVPQLDEVDVALPGNARSRVQAAGQVAEHTGMRSVWFQNSVRGSVGLALAVFIAQRASLQHGFWVVLGTLSVLRSNALGTGWSVLSALVGTGAGLIVGSLLVIAIGTHDAVLWGVLPVAILLAAYAPRAISFAAGQAGFTVVLFVLFNLIQPVGWKVGVVRIEDVAIGFGISIAVGLLFWPRGAGALLRAHLATAYSRIADYVDAAAREVIGGGESVREAGAADSALHQLDDVFRQYLAERSASSVNVEDIAPLIAGAARVRRTAQSLSALARVSEDKHLERCGENLDRELSSLHSWYVSFGYALANERPAPSCHVQDAEGNSRLLECVRDAVRDRATVTAALVLLWASQHLENLRRMEAHLAERANAVRSAASGEAGVWRRLLSAPRGRLGFQ